MELSKVALGTCPKCEADVLFGDVIGTAVLSDGRAFRAHCRGCGALARYDYTEEELRQVRAMLKGVNARRRPAPVPSALDPDFIGRSVQGFRIDLDRVESIADLLPDWEYEDTYAFWRVPREVEGCYAELHPSRKIGGEV